MSRLAGRVSFGGNAEAPPTSAPGAASPAEYKSRPDSFFDTRIKGRDQHDGIDGARWTRGGRGGRGQGPKQHQHRGRRGQAAKNWQDGRRRLAADDDDDDDDEGPQSDDVDEMPPPAIGSFFDAKPSVFQPTAKAEKEAPDSKPCGASPSPPAGASDNEPRRSNVNSQRHQRMFASIQNSLGGPHKASPVSTSTSTTRRDQRRSAARRDEEEPIEKLDDIDAVINQIADLNMRYYRSANQIKRNIVRSAFLDECDEPEWEQICAALVKTAIEHSEPGFVADICISFLKYPDFSYVISTELQDLNSSYILSSDDERPVPAFMAAILCCNWPRDLAEPEYSINAVLFTAMCNVKGWIGALAEDNQNFYKKEKKRAYVPLHPDEDDEVNSDEEETAEKEQQGNDEDSAKSNDELKKDSEEKKPADPVFLNRCARALCELCDAAQRSLWMRCPTLCDEIYDVIKPALTHNNNISGESKIRLLQTFMAINTWTKSRAVTTKIAQTQTCDLV